MSVTIIYNSNYADYSISSYIKEWTDNFGDTNQAVVKQRGEFSGGSGHFDGTQYAVTSSYQNDAGMIVEGDLKYSFRPQHTLYGQMDTIQFGELLNPNSNGLGQDFGNVHVTFNGLDISSEYNPEQTAEQNHDGDIHKSISGLMRANPDPMLDILKDKGIDVDTPLKDLSIASQYPDSGPMADAPMVDTVGVSDCGDMLLAA